MDNEDTNIDAAYLADLADWADSVVKGVGAHLDDTLLSPAARTLIDAACELLKGDKGAQDRIAYGMYLDALIASPEAVQASLSKLRDHLRAEDPLATQ